ncbi:MAG: hypothetical protein ABSG37_03230 [Candidatus Limnocylindrales bacterium]|jgi:hypothetical protein
MSIHLAALAGSSDFRDRLIRASAPVTAFVVVGALVVVGSRAAFSATTANSANSWSSGTVVLADDDSGSAMFTVTAMKPGSSNVKCIAVTYSGSLTPATINLYGTVAGSGLSTYLTTTVEIGTGGSFSSCTGFISTSTIYSGTLANFGTTYTNWATGLATWSPASTPDSRTFRVTTTLPSGTGNAAQGLNATATFTWEAQNQ